MTNYEMFEHYEWMCDGKSPIQTYMVHHVAAYYWNRWVNEDCYYTQLGDGPRAWLMEQHNG